jgi:hypothetical protein
MVSARWVCNRTISCSVTIPIGASSAGDITTKRLTELSIILETASRIVASGGTVSAGRSAHCGLVSSWYCKGKSLTLPLIRKSPLRIFFSARSGYVSVSSGGRVISGVFESSNEIYFWSPAHSIFRRILLEFGISRRVVPSTCSCES